jgi:hypothetical protein
MTPAGTGTKQNFIRRSELIYPPVSSIVDYSRDRGSVCPGKFVGQRVGTLHVDGAPAHVGITCDEHVRSQTSLVSLDGSNPVPVQPDATSGRQFSVRPMTDLAPGPYPVAWASLSAGPVRRRRHQGRRF